MAVIRVHHHHTAIGRACLLKALGQGFFGLGLNAAVNRQGIGGTVHRVLADIITPNRQRHIGNIGHGFEQPVFASQRLIHIAFDTILPLAFTIHKAQHLRR